MSVVTPVCVWREVQLCVHPVWFTHSRRSSSVSHTHMCVCSGTFRSRVAQLMVLTTVSVLTLYMSNLDLVGNEIGRSSRAPCNQAGRKPHVQPSSVVCLAKTGAACLASGVAEGRQSANGRSLTFPNGNGKHWFRRQLGLSFCSCVGGGMVAEHDSCVVCPTLNPHVLLCAGCPTLSPPPPPD